MRNCINTKGEENEARINLLAQGHGKNLADSVVNPEELLTFPTATNS